VVVLISRRGDYTGERWWYVWWFSPLLDLVFFLLLFSVLVFSCRGDSQGGDVILNSRSPLCWFSVYIYVLCWFAQDVGEIHRRGDSLIFSFSPLWTEILNLRIVVYLFCAFCWFAFVTCVFWCFSVLCILTLSTKWGPMVDVCYSIGGRLPLYYIYIV